MIEPKLYMNPTKNLIDPKLYMNRTNNLIEPQLYMNPNKNLIEPKLYTVRLLFSLNGFTVGALPVYWLHPVYYN